MVQKNLNKFKKIFLLEFTKQLIKHSDAGEFIELESQIEEKETEEKENFENFRSRIRKKVKITNNVKGKLKTFLPSITPQKRFNHIIRTRKALPVLRIPSPKLPPRLQYLRPNPTKRQIDLGKLNPLIQDPVVQSIECNGPDKPIIVRIPSTKQTKIVLNKEEINEVIQKFSQAAKIPVSKGIFKVAFGRLIFSAIVSEVVDSKFIIKKIKINPIFRN
jgi:CRISPR/Cas system-associated protein Cas7 (RAMP superfamily)